MTTMRHFTFNKLRFSKKSYDFNPVVLNRVNLVRNTKGRANSGLPQAYWSEHSIDAKRNAEDCNQDDSSRLGGAGSMDAALT